jgi:hypothetical protein
VTHFLQQIHSSIAPAGGGVNPSKTKSSLSLFSLSSRPSLLFALITERRVNFNLEFEGRGERIYLSKCTDPVIQWCGLRINTITLEVEIEFPLLVPLLIPSLSPSCQVMPSFNRLLDRPIQYSMNRECLQVGSVCPFSNDFLCPFPLSLRLRVELRFGEL